jgi:hypothetical protein
MKEEELIQTFLILFILVVAHDRLKERPLFRTQLLGHDLQILTPQNSERIGERPRNSALYVWEKSLVGWGVDLPHRLQLGKYKCRSSEGRPREWNTAAWRIHLALRGKGSKMVAQPKSCACSVKHVCGRGSRKASMDCGAYRAPGNTETSKPPTF